MHKAVIIIPCFNEEKRIPLDAFRAFLATEKNIDFCFVNDGSSDQTLALIQSFCSVFPDRLFCFDLEKNSGKAEAVRQGMLKFSSALNYDLVGFLDADLSTPLSELIALRQVFSERTQVKMVLGSRVKRLGANIVRSEKRHVLGRVFSTLASLATDIAVYDSQCGAKMFKREVVRSLFDQPFLSKWIFDLELLVRLKAEIGNKEFLFATFELPLSEWKEVGGSKLSLKHMLRIPLDLWNIYSNYKRR